MHITTNLNYITGYVGGTEEHRSFFVFDLSGITTPILSAQLRAFNVADSGSTPGGGFRSSQPSETLRLFDVSTSLSSLTGGTGGIAAFNDLGAGTVYGSTSVSDSDDGAFVTVALNSDALSALNLATGQFALGGTMTSLSASTPSFEYVFSFSSDGPVYLDLTTQTVPEPTSLALLGMGAIGLCGYRLRRKRHQAV